jgi:ABC-type Na+ efflux pump permease subunit
LGSVEVLQKMTGISTALGIMRSRRVFWTLICAVSIYVAGLVALPPITMSIPPERAAVLAQLARINSAIYAPLTRQITRIPLVGDAWIAYLHFWCELLEYECASTDESGPRNLGA